MGSRVSNSTLFYIMVAAVGAILILGFELPPLTVILALGTSALIMRFGIGALRSLAEPIPEPPPPGELRKVKIQFRCSICGSEVRMTAANDEMPEPPRHCLEDMDLVAPTFE